MISIKYLESVPKYHRVCLFQNTLTQCQDKAFRRIAELKEQIQLDQLAKQHIEENYALMMEEKQELIKVLHMQVCVYCLLGHIEVWTYWPISIELREWWTTRVTRVTRVPIEHPRSLEHVTIFDLDYLLEAIASVT